MESGLRCKCKMNFASLERLNYHKQNCTYSNNTNIFSISNKTPAELAHKNLNIPYAASQIRMNPIYDNLQRVRRCIMDSNIIADANKSIYENICSNQECIDEYLLMCKKKLICGHQCLGLYKDNCLNCLNENCRNYVNSFNQNASSLCPICLTDSLSKFSIIQLPCKHYMHRKCLLKILKLKWSTEDINFNYLKCPVCKKIIECDSIMNSTKDLEIIGLIKESYTLFEKISKITDLINEEEKQKQPIPMEKFSFYLCEKCNNPFSSGLKECREELEYGEKPVRLCFDCFDFTSIKGKTNCEIHGRKNIQYKCKFCCNLASHFCFGTTHFCEDCHLVQIKGNYITNKSKEELSHCLGIDSCQLGLEHPPNGEEFGLYCILCIK
jgi:hypothetical protein